MILTIIERYIITDTTSSKNLRNQSVNASVDKLVAISQCNSFVHKQTNTQTYDLIVL